MFLGLSRLIVETSFEALNGGREDVLKIEEGVLAKFDAVAGPILLTGEN